MKTQTEEIALGPHAAEVHPIEFPAGIHIENCYQCGKCTAGCPVSERMDMGPAQLMRLVQLGETEAPLKSQAIWECVSCQTCSTRCPKDVDIAAVMDALREISLAQGMVAPSQAAVVAFQKAFLDNIRRNGRLAELELIAQFKTAVFFRSRNVAFLFRDSGLAPELGKRKKLHFIPGRAQDRKVIERIFSRCAKQEKK
jgi:heterodisulfide reductase subunit C2